MAIIDMDGFETGIVRMTNTTMGAGVFVATTGRDGVGIGGKANTGEYLTRAITSGSDTLFWHQGHYLGPSGFDSTSDAGSVWVVMTTDAGPVKQMTLNMDDLGHLTLRRGDAASTRVATSTQVFNGSVQAWHSFETKLTIHPTAGECVVKVDGVEWINYVGNTKASGTSTRPTAIRFGISGLGAGYVLDDVLICDTTGSSNNSWTGEVSIVGLRANGNGATSGLVGSDGNSVDNYLQVDEYPLTTTDYNGSVTVGAFDTYAMSNVGKTGTVLGVQQHNYAVKSDAGAKSFKHVRRSGSGTVTKSADVPLSTTYLLYTSPVLQTDDAGAAWTVTNVDAYEFGFEVGA